MFKSAIIHAKIFNFTLYKWENIIYNVRIRSKRMEIYITNFKYTASIEK